MIYDIFPFFNELDLLEIRLEELSPVVDYFVLTESLLDMRGRGKLLFYYENRERFARWEKKIIHAVVPNPVLGENKEYEREAQHRDYACAVLKQAGAKDDDLILSSDADEIVSRACLPSIAFCRKQFPNLTDQKLAVILAQRMYYFNFNLRWWLDWHVANAFPFKFLHEKTVSDLRLHSPVLREQIVPDGGWHFSFMGGRDMVIQKCSSWLHWKDGDNPTYVKALEAGGDPYQLRQDRVRRVMIDSTYPDHIYLNQSMWTKKGYIQA